jgi:hypothetical protein
MSPHLEVFVAKRDERIATVSARPLHGVEPTAVLLARR